MATITCGPGGFDMVNPQLDLSNYAGFTNGIPNSIQFNGADPTDFLLLEGSGLAFNANPFDPQFGLTAGTLTHIELVVNGALIFDVAGANVNATVFSNRIELDQISSALSLVLAGSDRFNGSALADKLKGYDGNDKMFGKGGKDDLQGGNGNDTLNGGAGADKLTGGAGADKFVLSAAPGAGNRDVITDFNTADDVIQLENSVFTVLGAAGALDAGKFVIGTDALDGDDAIIYDSVTGKLFYDADGVGGASKMLIAQLSAGLALTAGDFQLI